MVSSYTVFNAGPFLSGEIALGAMIGNFSLLLRLYTVVSDSKVRVSYTVKRSYAYGKPVSV